MALIADQLSEADAKIIAEGMAALGTNHGRELAAAIFALVQLLKTKRLVITLEDKP